MRDRLFDATNCERCGQDLIHSARIMSWFTEETICMGCSRKEKEVKTVLRNSGQNDMEGCGFVPQV